MTTLAIAILAALVGVYAVTAWRAVRMAQLTDSSIREEWTAYRKSTDGVLEAYRGNVVGALGQVASFNERVTALETEKRSEGLARVGGKRA